MRKTDGESLTAKEGCEEENTRAGQSGATPELSADAPRQSEDAARSGEMPEQGGNAARSGEMPEQGGDAARSGETTEQSGNAAARSRETTEQGGNAARSGETTEQSGNAARSGEMPEQGENAARSGEMPEQGGNAARSGEMPERSGDTAERSADAPGRARGAGCGSAVLAERMLRYFSCPPDPRKQAPPSFVGFALSQDMTVTELEALCRKNRRLGEAYGECRQRVMQWLIDGALQKYYDSSLVKLLLTSCYGVGEEKAEEVDRTFRIEVV